MPPGNVPHYLKLAARDFEGSRESAKDTLVKRLDKLKKSAKFLEDVTEEELIFTAEEIRRIIQLLLFMHPDLGTLPPAANHSSLIDVCTNTVILYSQPQLGERGRLKKGHKKNIGKAQQQK